MSTTAPIQPLTLGGVGVIGPSSTNELTDVQIRFPSPTPFTGTPFVVAVPFQDPTYNPSNLPDTFALTVTDVEPFGFQVNVLRVDTTSGGWSQNLQVIYVAVAS